MIVKLHLIGEIAVALPNPKDTAAAMYDARQQLDSFRESALPGREYGISIFENPAMPPAIDPEDEAESRLATNPEPSIPDPDTLITELLARLGQALRYLEHPDVAAMPFAIPTEVCARHCKEAIDNATAYLREKRK